MASNYETALKAEMKRVVRCFQHYNHNQRADLMSSRRMGLRQREATGRFFYVHPDVPGLAFNRRSDAAAHAMDRA